MRRFYTVGEFFSFLALAEHPLLSGNWKLDLAASDFGNAPAPTSGQLAISASAHKTIHVTQSLQGAHDQRTEESEWKIDDHYHPIQGNGGGELLAKWEGQVLIGKRQMKTGVEEIRFSLAPGGESLTESIESGGNVTTLIWHRE